MTSRLRPAAAIALLVPTVAAAQQSDSVARDSVRELPTIQVIGSVLPAVAPGVGSMVPGRSAVIGGDDARALRPRALHEALAAQPGVSLYDDLGSPWKQTLVVRGFTTSPVVGLPQGVSVFVDGVPVNEPDAGQVNFELLPLEHVERIEVLSGTASLLGPNSLGGAVNLVTRRGGGGTRGVVEVAGGSYGRRALDASATGSARGWSWYAGGSHDRERGWRRLTSARLGDAFVNVGRFGGRAGVGLQLHGARSRAETAGSLPESVYEIAPDSNLSAGDFEDLEQLHLALTGYMAAGRGSATFNLYARRHDAERFNVNQQDDPDVRGFSRNRTVGAAADWRTTAALGRGTVGLRIGGGGQWSRTGIRLFAERIDPGLTTDVESPIAKLDAFAVADWDVGPLVLSGGARFDAVRIPFRNRLDAARDTTSNYRRLSPRGGVRVRVGRGLTAYASAGQSFRAPAVIELACADPEEPCPLPFALGDDPPLDPVVATTLEAGGQLARGRVILGVSAFRTDVRDDIFLFPYEEEGEPEGSTIDGYFANVDRTRRAGIELDARLLVPGGHALTASWALARATFESDAEIFSVREAVGEENEVRPGDRMPLVPAQTAALGALLQLRRNLELAGDARWTGERWLRGDEANETAPLPGYWIADLRASWNPGSWGADLVVHNALDSRHAVFGTFNINQGAGDVLERFLTPSQPRTVQLVLRRRFGARD